MHKHFSQGNHALDAITVARVCLVCPLPLLCVPALVLLLYTMRVRDREQKGLRDFDFDVQTVYA